MAKIIISFILFGLSIFLVFGYVKPTFNKAQTIKDVTITQYDGALEKAELLDTKKRQLTARYAKIPRESRDRLKKLLPPQVDNVQLVLDIDGVASTHNIRIGSVKIHKSVNKKTDAQTGGSVTFNDTANSTLQYRNMSLSFVAVTTYADFKAFMQDIEKSLRIVDLSELEITAIPPKKNANGTLVDPSAPQLYKFSITIKTYWIKKIT
jgi:Tfp pilus assembly protein PilO